MAVRVLIIEHDPGVVELLGQILRAQGYEVVTAATGAEGLRLAREFEPGVVLLDLLLPDHDGWDICRSFRAFSSVPILAQSAINDPQVIASILDAGADDHLVRPVSCGVLIAHVHNLVRRPHASTSARPWERTAARPPTTPFHA